MTVRAVGEPIVDLVGVNEQVVPDGDLGQLVLDRIGQDSTGRVAGIAQEQRLRPRRDRPFDRGRVEGKVVLKPGRHVDRRAAGEADRRQVGHVRRLVQDHLVAGIAGRPQGQVDRLRGADRDQDLAGRVIAHVVAPLEMDGQRAAQLECAVIAGVVGPTAAQAGDTGLDDSGWGVEIGLPHPQADHVVHRGQDVKEAADPRRRDGSDPLGQGALGQRSADGGRRWRLSGHAAEYTEA